MDLSGLNPFIRTSVILAQKMVEYPDVKLAFTHICDVSTLKSVIMQSNIMFRSLPNNVYAETTRTRRGEAVDFNIYLSRKFSEQFRSGSRFTSIENDRLVFLCAVTIVHEWCHLSLRVRGIKDSPGKLKGFSGDPEAGEYMELLVFQGLVGLRLSHSKGGMKTGWDPATMRVTAVTVKIRPSKFLTIPDASILVVVRCARDNTPLPFEALLFENMRSGRKKNEHVLKRSCGMHECTRYGGHGAARLLDMSDADSHIHEGRCGLSEGPSSKRRR